jgi:hypothetical protein
VVQGDAQALPFADDSFDHVVCSEVLEHLPDGRGGGAGDRSSTEAQRLGGVYRARCRLPVHLGPAQLAVEAARRISAQGERPWSGIWYGHRRLYSPGQLARLLRDNGLVVEDQRGLTFRTLPFAHLLMYGIGKPLLQSGLLPMGYASRQIG